MRGTYSAAMLWCTSSFLRGVAHRRTLRLGIDHDAVGHFEIRRLVHEDVAVPCPGLDHRHGGVVGHKGNQARDRRGE